MKYGTKNTSLCDCWVLLLILSILHTRGDELNKAELAECGKSSNNGRNFTGSSIVSTNEWPWTVAIKHDPHYSCMAALISNQWLVLPAHCARNVTKDNGQFRIHARLGALDWDDEVYNTTTTIEEPIDFVAVHPLYSKKAQVDQKFHNIAVMRMKNPVQFTQNIRPVCLPVGTAFKTENYYNGKQGILIDKKYINLMGDHNEYLVKQSSVTIVDPEKCTQFFSGSPYYQKNPINETILCAGKEDEDSCPLSAGAFLILQNENRFYLVGLISNGVKCNATFKYTRVSSYLDWINKETGLNL